MPQFSKPQVWTLRKLWTTILIVGMLISIGIYVGTLASQVNACVTKIDSVEQAIYKIQDLRVVYARIDERLKAIERTLDEIKHKINNNEEER